MENSIDLRYGFPPLVNLRLLFLKPRPIGFEILQYPILIITALLLLLVFVLLLFTSIKLFIDAMKIRFEPGQFSAPVAILLLASIMFPPSLFWVIYFLLIITSPFYAMLFNLLKRFLRWLLHALRSFPPLNINFTPEHPPSPSPVLLQPQADASPEVNGIGALPTGSPTNGFNGA